MRRWLLACSCIACGCGGVQLADTRTPDPEPSHPMAGRYVGTLACVDYYYEGDFEDEFEHNESFDITIARSGVIESNGREIFVGYHVGEDGGELFSEDGGGVFGGGAAGVFPPDVEIVSLHDDENVVDAEWVLIFEGEDCGLRGFTFIFREEEGAQVYGSIEWFIECDEGLEVPVEEGGFCEGTLTRAFEP